MFGLVCPIWRITYAGRIGDWRVIFDYDRETETVLIRRVPPRGRAYER